MKIRIASLLLLLVSTAVLAQTVPANTGVLTWTAPTTNTDGTPLTDLASYNIYHGQSATTLVKVANVLKSAALTYTDKPTPVPATWYWAVTAVNTAGTESAKSAIVSKALTVVILVPQAPSTPIIK
jgi:peptidoglycan hydrolase-like amidase